MKPVFQTQDNKTGKSARKFPITDFNYHSVMLGYSGRCGRALEPSFHTLSRDYFNT